MSNIYDLAGNPKCLKYEFHELSTKMPGDTVSINMVLAAAIFIKILTIIHKYYVNISIN